MPSKPKSIKKTKMKTSFLSTINSNNKSKLSAGFVKAALGTFAMIFVVSCKVGEEYTRPDFGDDVSSEFTNNNFQRD